MSSLAEINQRLIEQNNEQERTSVAIEDVRKAIIAQMKTERRGRLDELEGAKKVRRGNRPTSFVGGLAEGTGLAGLGRFAQGLLGALFGGLSGGAIAGLAGTIAGKLLKGTLLAGLITTFGEDVIKSLFAKLKEQGIDFGFTNDQENEIASRVTDGLFGAIIAGIIFKNPLVRLGAFIVTAFKDKIFSALEYALGIKITNMGGKDGYVVNIPWMDKEFTPGEEWMNGILGVVGGFFVFVTGKILKGIKNLVFGGQTKLDAKISAILEENQKKLNRLEADLEAERQMRKQQAKYSTSRTQAAGNLADDLATIDESLRASPGSRGSDRGKLARDLAANRKLAAARALQNINASYKPISVGAAPIQPSVAQTATDELFKYDGKAINDVGFDRVGTKDGRVLFQDMTNKKFVSPEIVLDEVKINQAKVSTKAKNVVKGVGKVAAKYVPPVALAADVYFAATDEEKKQLEVPFMQRMSQTTVEGGAAAFDMIANGLGFGINYALEKMGSDARVKTDQNLSGMVRKFNLETAQMLYDYNQGNQKGGSGAVIVQDNSVKQGGSSTQVVNQMSQPVSSMDLSAMMRNQGVRFGHGPYG